MDDNKQTTGPIMNGDDELAKTLAGGLKFEETPPASNVSATSNDSTPPSMDDLASAMNSATKDDEDVPKSSTGDTDNDEMDHGTVSTGSSSDLDEIKSSALDDLKPLVGKLNLSPEEKFDTLLLIIRSTDDKSLLPEAHEAAKKITDDTKRAEALLDVIKEVDYFKGKSA